MLGWTKVKHNYCVLSVRYVLFECVCISRLPVYLPGLCLVEEQAQLVERLTHVRRLGLEMSGRGSAVVDKRVQDPVSNLIFFENYKTSGRCFCFAYYIAAERHNGTMLSCSFLQVFR